LKIDHTETVMPGKESDLPSREGRKLRGTKLFSHARLGGS